MDNFGKLLIIRSLCFQRFFSVANSQKSRRRYGAIALPLRCNRVAVTVQSHCRYGVTATAFGYYRNKKRVKMPPTVLRRGRRLPFSRSKCTGFQVLNFGNNILQLCRFV